MPKVYKPTRTSSLFPEENRLEKLSQQGDPLERLNKAIEWKYFREIAEKTLNTGKMTNSGPKPYDPLLMFKILVLQRYYNLSDGQIEYQILDRLSFCRFLGLSLNDRVPDEKTIWDFRDRLVGKGLDKELFDQFAGLLEKHGLIAHEGKIIDASFVEAPASATPGTRTSRSRKASYRKNGRKFQTRKGKRTPMPAGQRRTTKRTTGIRTTPR
jgi:IS5 family transposase